MFSSLVSCQSSMMHPILPTDDIIVVLYYLNYTSLFNITRCLESVYGEKVMQKYEEMMLLLKR